MKRKNQKENIKQITFCAMLIALGIVFLGIGALIELLDISMAVLASACVIVASIEYGKGAPWMVYIGISILSFLLLPSKLPGIFFALFFGFYPILKNIFETRSKVVCWILKEVTFNISLTVIIIIYMSLFFQDVSLPLPIHWLIVIAVVLCEFAFILYDVALKRIAIFYILILRKKLKLK